MASTFDFGIENGDKYSRMPTQLVDNQGDIVTTPGNTSSMLRDDWSDYQAWKAQWVSQQEQRAYDLSLWKYQQSFLNEYNSPVAQMARYGEAGLNPNLIYSQQNTASNVGMQNSTPLKGSSNWGRSDKLRLEATQQLVNSLYQAYNMYQDSRFKDAQIQQMEASTRYTQEQAGKTALDNKWNAYLMGLSEDDYSNTPRGTGYWLSNLIKEGQHNLQNRRLGLYDTQEQLMIIDMAYKNALIHKANTDTTNNSMYNGIFTAEPFSEDWWDSVLYNAREGLSKLPIFFGRTKN